MKTFDKAVAQEFQHVLLFIDEVFHLLKVKGLELSNTKLNTGDGEYGFYIPSKDNKSEIFVGLWMDFWVNKGNPICITLTSESRNASKYKENFRNFLNSKKRMFDSPLLFQECYTAAIKSEVIFTTDQEPKMAVALFELYHLLEFQNSNLHL